tara:strand:+ start:3162 stop:4214 length:1053 start_codon:yes stop_codon:yes gene_type:complete
VIENGLYDSFGRLIRDLRISITDRCNFRCLYCLPETEEAADFFRSPTRDNEPKPITRSWKPRSHFLTYEEIARVVNVLAKMGIHKIRLTGGEPLLRKDVPELVRKMCCISGIQDIALTTNGFSFKSQASELLKSGLKRVTFSLDSLDRGNFKRLTGRDGLKQLIEAINYAKELGFSKIKINAVIIRGLNDHEIESLADYARDQNLIIRFIEFMPLDSGRSWQRDHVMTGLEILNRLKERFVLEPLGLEHTASTAKRWRFCDGKGEIGLIMPVSEPFCGQCNRIRITADGKLRTCLFSHNEHDLKTIIRNNTDDNGLALWLREVVMKKEKGHQIGQKQFQQPERTMSAIGG